MQSTDLDLSNRSKWELLHSKTYKQQTGVLTERHGIVPILPIGVLVDTYTFIINPYNKKLPKHWRLGCRASMNLDLGGGFQTDNDIRYIKAQEKPCTLNRLNLVEFTPLQSNPYWLLIEFPYWMPEISIEIFTFVNIAEPEPEQPQQPQESDQSSQASDQI